jgi:hypothetical protein
MNDDEDWDVMDAREDSSDEGGEEYDITDDASKDLPHLGVAVVKSLDNVSRRYWNGRLFKAMDRSPTRTTPLNRTFITDVLTKLNAL